MNINIADLLKGRYIELSLHADSKKGIITQLVDLAAKSGKIKNKKAFLKAVLERERLGSTGIGNGVAIPHAKSKEVKGFVLVFARVEEGIDFGALDGEDTSLFFILASPEEEVGRHLKIMANISRAVQDKFIIERLKKAKEKKEVLEIISPKLLDLAVI